MKWLKLNFGKLKYHNFFKLTTIIIATKDSYINNQKIICVFEGFELLKL